MMKASYSARPEVVPGGIYTSMIMGNPTPGLKNGIPIAKVALVDFVTADSGHLLLPPQLAERAHNGLLDTIHSLNAGNGLMGRYVRAKFDPDTGCVDATRRISDLNRGNIIHQLVEVINPRSNGPIDGVDEIPGLRLCDHETCINPRHYDLEIGANLRKGRQDLDARLYMPLDDGRVVTAWGDELPNPEFSRDLLVLLRNESAPYRTDNKGKLTPSQLASIKFVPLTGCWAGDKYYRGDDIDLGLKKFQTDGYARLYLRYARSKSTAHKLGHRIIWSIFNGALEPGLVLNHRCGYRRCCNPLHLDQVDQYSNILHGEDMAMGRHLATSEDPLIRSQWWVNIISSINIKIGLR